MRRIVTTIFIIALIACLPVAGFSQDLGDNQFHFVASVNKFPEGDAEGDMTNIKFVGDTDQDGKGEFVFLCA